jgi:hypothetical protein
MRYQIAFSFCIKELDGKIVFQVNNAAIFKAEVELSMAFSA